MTVTTYRLYPMPRPQARNKRPHTRPLFMGDDFQVAADGTYIGCTVSTMLDIVYRPHPNNEACIVVPGQVAPALEMDPTSDYKTFVSALCGVTRFHTARKWDGMFFGTETGRYVAAFEAMSEFRDLTMGYNCGRYVFPISESIAGLYSKGRPCQAVRQVMYDTVSCCEFYNSIRYSRRVMDAASVGGRPNSLSLYVPKFFINVEKAPQAFIRKCGVRQKTMFNVHTLRDEQVVEAPVPFVLGCYDEVYCDDPAALVRKASQWYRMICELLQEARTTMLLIGNDAPRLTGLNGLRVGSGRVTASMARTACLSAYDNDLIENNDFAWPGCPATNRDMTSMQALLSSDLLDGDPMFQLTAENRSRMLSALRTGSFLTSVSPYTY